MDPLVSAALVKGTEQAAEIAKNEAHSLLGRFLGPLADEVGGMLGENFRVYRLKNQIRTLRKANKVLENEGVSPKCVNLKMFVPLIDAAALEDEETMSDLWAQLLATAANPNKKAPEAGFVEILKQLTSLQARLLQLIYTTIKHSNPTAEQLPYFGVSTAHLQTVLGVDRTEIDLAIDNLIRLRLVAFPAIKLGFIEPKDARFQLTHADRLCATSLGFAFTAACGADSSKKSESTMLTTSTKETASNDNSPKWG